jgi:cation transport regulator ChaC
MSRLAVFAYGSLVSRSSFQHTFGRRPEMLHPARLGGWRRRWSLLRDNLTSEKTFARRSGGELPRWVIGLNIEPNEASDPQLAPNGALIEISDGELERLDLRELRSDRVEVASQLSGGEEFDRIVAYTARPEHFAVVPPDGAVAMAPYLRAVEAAFRALGESEWELFMQTTGPPPVETIEPQLVRDEIPPGNPHEW